LRNCLPNFLQKYNSFKHLQIILALAIIGIKKRPPQYFFKKSCIFVSKSSNMVTLTLTLDLEESLVQAYQQAKAAEKKALKKKIEQLFTLQWRRQEVEAVRQRNVEALIQSMDELGKEAEANGLTEEISDQILAES
jgi:hypothetical protein